MISQAVLGVDPGVRGGMALLRPNGVVHHTWVFQPQMDELDLTAALSAACCLLNGLQSRVCFFERVGYMPTDGGRGAFTFGKIVGLLRGMLLASNIKLFDVSPMMWQASMGCLSGGNKNVTKRLAQELFPGIKITHAIADALLIAEFGRRRMVL